MELPKVYQAKNYEDDIYYRWESSSLFNPDECVKQRVTAKNAETFTIILPPPNVTGQLHLGHASMLAYQDLMVRYQRLQGKRTLWLPGTDHAAIATQTVVEKQLAKRGLSKEDLGREKFLEKVREYVTDSKKTIHKQIRKMGASLDWSREKYTLDESISKVVYHIFTKMYQDGLIYRGNRIVNWCPRCQSTLADDEVEHEEQQAKFYYLKYGPVVIATTRPETKIGDTGLAVHPNDKRYQKYIGKELDINLGQINIKVKVFADKEVNPEFGTGAIGVTPAHSQTDFAWAEKYNLKVIKVIGEDGNMTSAAGPYAGLTISECREKFLQDLAEAGLLVKEEEIMNNLAKCYRCSTAIEPLTSKQWFVDVNKKISQLGKSLKEISLEVVRKGLNGDNDKKIEIIPERFNKTYFHWMENLHDWCISRQIWWGHRIPVYYRKYKKNEEIYVGLKEPKGKGWIQDEDTLDTWFSSALWTFSTLDWPDGKDFKQFHPTQVLETGYDILFFWVARMILMTTYATGEIPFVKVYLHGLIRDKQGRKMSKSLGNGIDPLEMIDKYGADALRLSMLIGTSPGNDIKMYEEKISGYRNFVNKLWNISRFILISVDEIKEIKKQPKIKTLADEWILAELDKLIQEITVELDKFNFSLAAEKLYEFTWSKLADWYLEIAKIEKNKNDILNYLLRNILILWHPFTPYITEVIWTEAFNQNQDNKKMLMVENWPKVRTTKFDNQDFEIIKDLIIRIRNLRAEAKLDPGKIISVKIKTKVKLLRKQQLIIEKLAKVKIEYIAMSTTELMSGYLKWAGSHYEMFMQIGGEAKKKIEIEKKKLEKYIFSLEQKLTNKNFIKNAPAEIVALAKDKLNQAQDKLKKL